MKKGKKIIAVLLCAFIALAFTACREKENNLEYEYNKETDSYSVVYYTDTTSVKELTIPDEFNSKPVTEISQLAISSADTLEVINIGKNITYIDDWGITGCLHLKEINVSEENENYCSVDGVLFTKDKKTLVSYPNANTAVYSASGALEEKAKYQIPDGTEIISKCAFYKCYGLEEVILPDSIKIIDERAFHKCENMKSINFPEGLKAIGFDAFIGCLGLEEVTLPSTIEEIGEFAFYNASNIKHMEIKAKQENVTLGKQWEPSSTGRAIDIDIIWGE